MRLKSILLAGVIASSLAPLSSQADSNYFGVSLNNLGYKESGIDPTWSLRAVSLNVGHMYNKTWGVEARLGFGLSSDTNTIVSSGYHIPVELKLDNYFSALGVANFPINDKFNLYTKFGFTNASLTGTGSYNGWTATVSSSGTSLSIFGGLNYDIGNQMSLVAEFGSPYNRDGVTVTSLSLGLQKAF